ncbi:hypothetical protein CCR85_07725 [Rhodothalassium salexigens]|uniref:DUF2336 domain-containing protein n=1 Tax=Rhodothalassium salexigens TaxID=1086 RepID=UPI0019135D4B|nr:DUF2336 domain-containing protein [Rhodothalassium salexigens]MBK5911381.1 hypothetical protein [Rhodothalassium salexigens]MBK5920208.1 hypothetical protein [Rhodothalassium salexigens]
MTEGADDSERPDTPASGGLSPERLSYEQSREILAAGAPAQLTALARRPDLRPEILYYLAQQGPSGARLAVAQNPHTPIQADKLLAEDDLDDVRSELARKIARIVPTATAQENARLRESALAILETLAQDQVPAVRRILAEEVSAMPEISHALARQLAADPDEAVRCPMLEYSPLLGEDDLRELIAAGLTEAALTATARRADLPAAVADDVASTLEVPAVAALLTNESAAIREQTLERIIDQAEQVQALHQPLVMRPGLSQRAMMRIASFVASSLVETMADRNRLPARAKEQLLARVKKRMQRERAAKEASAETRQTARQMLQNGEIDDRSITDLIEQNRRDLVTVCLSLKSRIPLENVNKILDSKSPQAVTALAWRCGLRMRTAYLVQAKLALIPPGKLLAARQGQYYPMSRAEMEKQISFFL